MAWCGLGLLALVAAGIALTGAPAFLVLLTAASAGGALAVLSDTVPASLLTALPGRLVNLLENDLLQALPLYVLMGVLLDRLAIADALFRTSVRLLPKSAAAPVMAGLGLGALLGPMNGSVGASVLSLARAVEPRLDASGVPAPLRYATICVASTLGVVIPPSLVLILLGDAMLSAHTIAVTATGRPDRVINTQDVFHGALAPAGLFFAAALAVAWLTARGAPSPGSAAGRADVTARQATLALVALVALIGLLGGVAAGFIFPVEGAASGAGALLLGGLLAGRLRWAVLGPALADVMAITGALFALLIGATSLTLVLRLLGTDRLIGDWLIALPGGDVVAVVTVLAIIGLSAFVLDAFEIIFVVVPIVVPPLLIRVADARWVAVLVLLTLQMSFLLPPFGYALMMLRGTLKLAVPLGPLTRALAPFLLAQWLVLAIVLAAPRLVHLGEPPGDRLRTAPSTLSPADVDDRLRQMIPPPPEVSAPDLRP
ncbi:MAG TPA: TRAP transporter large permease subunit [Xanthobacteraceae bacterium]|nr:TRAP transporter large permease subunit [Xanthobacteraceae bacterium]